jgi:hypothetical protein
MFNLGALHLQLQLYLLYPYVSYIEIVCWVSHPLTDDGCKPRAPNIPSFVSDIILLGCAVSLYALDDNTVCVSSSSINLFDKPKSKCWYNIGAVCQCPRLGASLFQGVGGWVLFGVVDLQELLVVVYCCVQQRAFFVRRSTDLSWKEPPWLIIIDDWYTDVWLCSMLVRSVSPSVLCTIKCKMPWILSWLCCSSFTNWQALKWIRVLQ